MTRKAHLARIDTPLKLVLEADGRRQNWLAERLDVDSRQVWGWVHGIHEPADATKQRIADLVGRPVAELFPGAGAAHSSAVSTNPTSADEESSALEDAA